MSGSFFAGAWKNHQMPQSVFNGPSGALPPTDTSGYGNGLNAQADAKINYNSTLLGDLAPYAYGKPGRLSSQTAFLAIPHMLQKVVPVLSIPSSQWPCTDVTKLYHSVDDGDVAFTINIDRTSTKFAEGPQLFDKVGALRAIDPFCNLCTVNYLLAGIQMFSDIPDCTAWTQFIRDIGMYDNQVVPGRISASWQVLKLVRDVFIPFGVPRGSDMQGGQTQGSNAPNIYPVDHVTSMLMDGKCINLVNLWRRHDISSGDDMILVLKKMVPTEYVLSRQTGSYNRQTFSSMRNNAKDGGGTTVDLEERRQQGVWQLVPYIYDMRHSPENPSEYDFRENGYWHICKALQMFPSDPRFEFDNYNDATKYRTTGELMEVSFQPLFIEGQPDGSSRRIICDRHNYPAHTEKLGIGVSSTNGVSSLTGAGPATNAWAAYLQQKRKRRENDEDDKYMPNNRYRARARFGVGGGGAIMGAGMQDANGVYQQDYIHPIQNAGGVVQPTTMAQSYNTPEIIPAVQQAGAGVGGAGVGAAAVGNDEADPPPAAGSESVGERLKAALASVGSSSPPSQGGGVGTKKGGGGDTGKAAGKRGGKTASAASGNMGLSGSYISNSGVSSDTTGSVRASLLSGTTPPEQEH